MSEVTFPAPVPYPVSLSVDYPEQQSRWKAVFRLPLAIPVFLYYLLLSSAQSGALWLLWLVILLRGRIPRWLFDFNLALERGIARAGAYFGLLTDAYPPFEGEHPVHLEIRYPERISRRKLLFWKIITSVPHIVVIYVLQAVALAVIPIAWVAIMFTGRFPKGLHDFVSGVLRWQRRVNAYALSLTDEFPPYSLAPDASAGSRRSTLLSAAVGVVLIAAAIGGITALVIYVVRNSEQEVSVSYQRLVSGDVLPGEAAVLGDSVGISLDRARDPADASVPFLQPGEGKRFVGFEMTVQDVKRRSLRIDDLDFWLDDSLSKEHAPFLVLVNKRTVPEKVSNGEVAKVELIFELDSNAVPTKLHYDTESRFLKTLVYTFDR